jgi:hypothetical protein
MGSRREGRTRDGDSARADHELRTLSGMNERETARPAPTWLDLLAGPMTIRLWPWRLEGPALLVLVAFVLLLGFLGWRVRG